MSRVLKQGRPVNPPREDARGVCRLTLQIDGVDYRVRPVACDPRSDADRGFRLLKQAGEGDVYDVAQTGWGTVECSCPDFVFRRQGTGTVCKHGAALVALGLLARKGGAR